MSYILLLLLGERSGLRCVLFGLFSPPDQVLLVGLFHYVFHHFFDSYILFGAGLVVAHVLIASRKVSRILCRHRPLVHVLSIAQVELVADNDHGHAPTLAVVFFFVLAYLLARPLDPVGHILIRV